MSTFRVQDHVALKFPQSLALSFIIVMIEQLTNTVEKAIELAPKSNAYGARTGPWIGVDENLNSRVIWNGLEKIVGTGLADGTGSLWYEIYRNKDGKPVAQNQQLNHKEALKELRRNDSLQRVSIIDREIASRIITSLFLHKHVIVLTSDFGLESEGLRFHLNTCVSSQLNSQTILGVTVILKRVTTSYENFIIEVGSIIGKKSLLAGFREIEV